jgi:hypothetical protein
MTIWELIEDLQKIENKDVEIFVSNSSSGETQSLSCGFMVDRQWINSCDAGDIIDHEGNEAFILSFH